MRLVISTSFSRHLARCGDRAKTCTPGNAAAHVAMAGWSVDTHTESKPPYVTIAFNDHSSSGRDPNGACNKTNA
jgi:hypothetical protein